MLLNVGFTDLRQTLADKLDKVEKGDIILIERRGKVIAKIVPVNESKKVPSWKRNFTPVKLRGGGTVSETIEQMRSESRH